MICFPRYLVAINFGPDDDEVNIAGSHYDVPESADVAITTRFDMDVEAGGSANLKKLMLAPGEILRDSVSL